MLEILFAYFERNCTLTPEDKALIELLVVSRTLRKGEFLLREGDEVRYGAFVAKGFLRSYIIDNKGREHIIQFAPENWWISDKQGMAEGAKATFFIDAIEDSEVLLMDLNGHKTLLQQVPCYGASFQTGMQKRSAAKDKRIMQSLSATAEERYNDFISTYPSIVQRVPQHMLASFLGLTPETVSRIRKQLSKKQR
jgi:CRP-like cAMP-binding protein